MTNEIIFFVCFITPFEFFPNSVFSIFLNAVFYDLTVVIILKLHTTFKYIIKRNLNNSHHFLCVGGYCVIMKNCVILFAIPCKN